MSRLETGRDALVADLREEARSLGLPLFGVADPAPSEHAEAYLRWLDAGMHGEMAYLERPDAVGRRADLRGTMPEVRSVIVVGDEHGGSEPTRTAADPSLAEIARYARGRDYHRVLKKKLLALLRWLDARVEGGVRGRAYVDTGPILERELGVRAGLGWLGRNSMLIDPRRGSYFFLGVLLVDVELPPSARFAEDRCGTCTACLDACPTGALLGRDEDGAPVVDARRCISYLTIELRGPIPEELRPGIGNRVFGCDICQEVCPWNRFAVRGPGEPGGPDGPYAHGARAGLVSRRSRGTSHDATAEASSDAMDAPHGAGLITLADELLGLDDHSFRERFRGSPIKRAGRGGLLRNVCVALGNWGDERAGPPLTRALADADRIVREHAAWALARIAGRRGPRG